MCFWSVLDNLHNKCDTLVSRMDAVRTENHILKLQLDRYEQYSRRNSVRIYGIAQRPEETNTYQTVVKLINNTLHLKMQHEVLNRSDTLSRATLGGKPGPIIAKCTAYSHRQKVLSARKLLKRSSITIVEDLTRIRASRREKRALDKFGRKNVWTL